MLSKRQQQATVRYDGECLLVRIGREWYLASDLVWASGPHNAGRERDHSRIATSDPVLWWRIARRHAWVKEAASYCRPQQADLLSTDWRPFRIGKAKR